MLVHLPLSLHICVEDFPPVPCLASCASPWWVGGSSWTARGQDGMLAMSGVCRSSSSRFFYDMFQPGKQSALARASNHMAHFYDALHREAPLYTVRDKV